jgi:hypothetical protein
MNATIEENAPGNVWDILQDKVPVETDIPHWAFGHAKPLSFRVDHISTARMRITTAKGSRLKVFRTDFENIARYWPEYRTGHIRLIDLRHISRRTTYIHSLLHYIFPSDSYPARAIKVEIESTAYKKPKHNQLVGNIGLYAVCYQLSRRGWNVMPTSRNARGIDILAYDQDGGRKISIQVKALANATPVGLGTDPSLRNLIADYFIIARSVKGDTPEYFIAKTDEVTPLVYIRHKKGKTSCWLQPKDYNQFEDKWETIGKGWGQAGE